MRECHNTSMHLRACSSVLSATEKDASKITREGEGQRERGSEKQRMKQGKGNKSGGEGAGAAQEQKHPRAERASEACAKAHAANCAWEEADRRGLRRALRYNL